MDEDRTTQLLSLSLSALLSQTPTTSNRSRYPDISETSSVSPAQTQHTSNTANESLYFSVYQNHSPTSTSTPSGAGATMASSSVSSSPSRQGRFVDLTLSQPQKTVAQQQSSSGVKTLQSSLRQPSSLNSALGSSSRQYYGALYPSKNVTSFSNRNDDDGDEAGEQDQLMDQSGFVPTFFKSSYSNTAPSRTQNMLSHSYAGSDADHSLSDSMNRKLLSDDEYGSDDDTDGDSHAIYIDPAKRLERDIIWKYIYSGLFILWVVLSFYSFLRKADLPTSSISPIDRRVLSAIGSNIGKVTLWISLSLLGGAAWLYFLSQFATMVVYATAFMVPAGLFSVSLYGTISTMYRFWSFPDGKQKTELAVFLATCLAGAIASVFLAANLNRKRGMATTMTHIVQLSCQVLKGNPRLFILSAGILCTQIIFSVVWVWVFARMLWNQYADSFMSASNDPSVGISFTWPLSSTVFISLLVYFWTSSLLQQFQKMVIASVVGKWYFHRFGGLMRDSTWNHSQEIFRRSFGTFSFAAFIIGGVRFYKYLLKKFGKNLRNANNRTLAGASTIILRFLHSLGNLLQDISSYTIIYAGLTGESFLSSAYTCTRLFRRNLVIGLMTHSLTRLLSILGRCMVSLFVSTLVFYSTFDTSTTSPQDGSTSPTSGAKLVGSDWIAASISGLVSYYILGMITQIIDSTIESTFICFLVDLDQDTCHCEAAHRIFSESLK